jgi:diguanylate cyclase (GGDEF)-like protein
LHYRCARYGTDYSLAICDVDNFKSYNDIYGHQAGDSALQAVAASLAGQGRQSDGIYRYGGEEFLFLLPGQTASGAETRLARALEAVWDLGIAHSGNPSGTLTVSAGLSAYTPNHRVSSERLLKEADMALYTAKAAGRNRVEVAPEVRQHTQS